MDILSFNFFLYGICGLWRPIEWSSKYSKILYGVFTCVTTYLVLFLVFIQLMDLILVIDNVEDFATNITFLISCTIIIFKIVTAITRRDKILNLIERLQKKPCIAYNEEENNIQIKFDRLIRSYSINYASMASVSCTGVVVGGLLNSLLKHQLPFRGWVPYDYTTPLLFGITLIQELTGMVFCTIINVATETTVLGFCLQICAQLEILKHRLHRMVKEAVQISSSSGISSDDASNETVRLSEHILHHLCIIRLAKMLNNIFSQVIFVQFFGSILVICSSLFHLTSHMTIADVSSLIIFTLCMFVQIFVYCWAGNEVMFQSAGLSDTVYQMNWILMPVNKQKDLLMIMKRSTRPIKFTSSFLVSLSLESYGNLLKASYSAFNLLQQS